MPKQTEIKRGFTMEQTMVEERDRITDRLEGILADIRYLEYNDPTIAVDTLDGCVARCAEILTRIKRLRRWVRIEMEDGIPPLGKEIPFLFGWTTKEVKDA